MNVRYCLSILLVFSIFCTAYSQCSISESMEIIDLTPLSANLIVDGSTNDDLAGTQSVDGVLLEFEHTQIGDLTIELTSPAGQSVVLVGPTGSFGNTSFTDWNVLFVPCSSSAFPDPGFSETWSNNQDWGNLASYAGSYYPFSACLEIFDTGSINGNWNIQVLDNNLFDEGELINATIFFSDPAGINCNQCSAEAGVFEIEELFVCTSNNLDIELEPVFPDEIPGLENEYMYIIRQDDIILDVSPTLNFSTYPEGLYQVCGVSVKNTDVENLQDFAVNGYAALLNEVSGQTPSICADINLDCVEVTVSQNNIEVDLDVKVCDQEVYEFGGELFTEEGMYQVVIPQPSGCDSVYNLNLTYSDIIAVISSSDNILDCNDPSIEITSAGSTINSNTEIVWSSTSGNISGDLNGESITVNEAGVYVLTLIDEECETSAFIEILSNSEGADLSIIGGTITCANPTVVLDLESNEPISEVEWSGPNGFMSSAEDVTVDAAGVYVATVTSDNGCVTVKSIIVNEAGSTPELVLLADDLSCGNPLVTIQVTASSNSLSYEWTGPDGFEFDGKNPIVSVAGLYEVVVTDDFGCSESFSIEIEGDAAQFEYIIVKEDILCNNKGKLEVLIDDENPMVEWTLPNGSTSNSILFEPIVPGEYELTLSSDGCTIEETIEIDQIIDPIPDLEIVQSEVIDCQDFDATLSVDLTGVESQVDSLHWIGPGVNVSNMNEISVQFAGQYILRIFTPNGCSKTFTKFLEYGANTPDVDLEIQNINCQNDLGEIVAIASENYDYLWTFGSGQEVTDSLVTSSVAEQYNLLVTNELGCVKQYQTSIIVDTISNSSGINTIAHLDCNNSTAEITLISSRFSQFSWSNQNGDDLGNGESLTVSTPGTYYVELVDASSLCESIDSIEITQDISIPDVQLEDQSFDCFTSTLLIEIESATTGVTYSWEGPEGFTSNVKSPAITLEGEYTVTVTGPNGCENIQNVTITNDGDLPELSANYSNDLDCINTETIVTGSTSNDGSTYQWVGPNNVFDQTEITVQEPGDYIYIVTGLNGCKDSLTINIPFTGEIPEFTALDDTLFCNESDLVLDVLQITPNLDFEWSGPNGYQSDLAQNVVSEPGEYVLVGLAPNGCVFSDTAHLVLDTIPPSLDFDTSDKELNCDIVAIDLNFTSDLDLSSITWTGPNGIISNDFSAEIIQSGSYSIEVVALNDCTESLTFEVTQDIQDPEFTVTSEDINCDNQKADLEVENVDTGASYSWSGPNFNSDLQNVAVEESGNYMLTVTGSNGCSATDEVVVEEDLVKPNLAVEGDTLTCFDEPIELFAESTTDPVVITWIGPNGFDSTGTSVLTDMPGEYFVNAIGENGCVTQIEIEVYDTPIYPDVSLQFSNNLTCDKDTVFLQAEVSGNITSTEWINEDFITEDLEFFTKQAGTFVFTAVGENGCITKDSVVVEADTIYPHVEVHQIGKILCDVNTASISGNGSSEGPKYSYMWQTDDGKINFGEETLNPIIEGEGTYLLAVQDKENGCINTETLVVEREESTLEKVDLDTKIQTCNDIEDASIQILDVSGGVEPLRYAIEGTSFTEIGMFEGLVAGDYLVSVKDSFGCVLDTLVSIDSKNQVEVNLGDDLDVLLGEEVEVVADINLPLTDIASIQWTPESIADCNFCTDFKFIPGANTIVTVFVVDEDGCQDQDQMIIRVDDEIKLYVPNIFTPNQDGVNDLFSIPVSPNVVKVNSFRVYDRWGSMVFRDTDFVPGSGEKWDGTHMNRSVKSGVYFYVGEVEMVNGDIRVIRGDITVVK